MEKQNATLASQTNFYDLEDAVNYLLDCKQNGENVYIEFNGHKLYSYNITMDKAFIELTGLTKAEAEAAAKELASTTSIKDGEFVTDHKTRDVIKDKYRKIKEAHIEEMLAEKAKLTGEIANVELETESLRNEPVTKKEDLSINNNQEVL